jgi:hypothetical protein
MSRDHDTHDAGGAAHPDRDGRIAVNVRELTEALTALGSWLAAANLELRSASGPASDRLSRAIQEGLAQHRRASIAIRELHNLLRAGRDDGPVSGAD